MDARIRGMSCVGKYYKQNQEETKRKPGENQERTKVTGGREVEEVGLGLSRNIAFMRRCLDSGPLHAHIHAGKLVGNAENLGQLRMGSRRHWYRS